MGTIAKRGGKYFAQIYVDRQRKSKTFTRLQDAKQWVLIHEAKQKDIGKRIKEIRLSACVEDYITEEVVGTPHQRHKISVLRMWCTRYFPDSFVHLLTEEDVREVITKRLSTPSDRTGYMVKESTVARQLNYLRAFFKWAISRGYATNNPCRFSNELKESPHRERVATPEELEILQDVAKWHEGEPLKHDRIQVVCASFLLSCLTGMRAGEMYQIERSWIHGDSLFIPAEATKTRKSRTIALCSRAQNILQAVCDLGYEPTIWGMQAPLRDAYWRRLRDRAELGAVKDSKGRILREGLNFHDGRATFCTWAASPGPDGNPRLDVMALARQTGHTTFKMLMKYYRPSISDVAKRLG